MKIWKIFQKKADFYGLGNKYNVDPLIIRIIRNRDIIEERDYDKYLRCDLNEMYSPYLLGDMKKVVDIIVKSINNNEKIRIIGDYDIDGVTSGFILCDALEKLGANIDFDVPDRIIDGFGLNERLITKANDDGVDLIVTCDNGIAAARQVEYGKSLGMKIIVTDHHEVPYDIVNGEKIYRLPETDAVVDAKIEGDTYPFKELCGAGIAFKVICSVSERFIPDEKERKDFLREYLGFAAIGTIGDIVPLKDENRIIAKNGLREVNRTTNLGLKKLIEVNMLSDKEIKSYHIGFVIGPCINSGGRLESAMKAFKLFRCKDEGEAMLMAENLKALNDERKNMTEEFSKYAFEIIDNEGLYNNSIIIVYLKGCHESLAGIIAGRIKEKYYRPAIALTDGETMLKGSARSIEGYSIIDELIRANSIYKEENGEELIAKFGGHKMAAGLSVEADKLPLLTEIMNSFHDVTENIYDEEIMIDVNMPFSYISMKLIGELDMLEPFGANNKKPVFAEKIQRIERFRVFGKNNNVISMRIISKNGSMADATLFKDKDEFFDDIMNFYGKSKINDLIQNMECDIKMKVLYYPVINEYNGTKSIKVVISNYMWYN